MARQQQTIHCCTVVLEGIFISSMLFFSVGQISDVVLWVVFALIFSILTTLDLTEFSMTPMFEFKMLMNRPSPIS